MPVRKNECVSHTGGSHAECSDRCADIHLYRGASGLLDHLGAEFNWCAHSSHSTADYLDYIRTDSHPVARASGTAGCQWRLSKVEIA